MRFIRWNYFPTPELLSGITLIQIKNFVEIGSYKNSYFFIGDIFLYHYDSRFTVVLIPPRTLKSPNTFRCFGLIADLKSS